MSTAYESAVSLFYHLANLFFWPVAIALLILFSWSLLDLGRLFYQAWRRRREAGTDLVALARRLKTGTPANGRHRFSLSGVRVSSSLRGFWFKVEERLTALEETEHIDLWLEEVLEQEEIEITSQLDRSRALVRIGPMLGLSGTIIPLGPALQALLGGDMPTMVNHLVIGFGAVVCGLVLSGISYGITLVRERWARVDLKEMENFCELLMRARKGAAMSVPSELENAGF